MPNPYLLVISRDLVLKLFGFHSFIQRTTTSNFTKADKMLGLLRQSITYVLYVSWDPAAEDELQYVKAQQSSQALLWLFMGRFRWPQHSVLYGSMMEGYSRKY